MRLAASTAETPLASSRTSAIGPILKRAPPYIGPVPVKTPAPSRMTRHSASTGRLAGKADLGADAAIEQRPLAGRCRQRRRFRIDDHADHGPLGLCRDQRPQQADRVRAAAGAGIVLNVGQHDRLRRPRCQTQRLGDPLVRLVDALGEIGFARLDRGGDPVGGGLGGLAVIAVDDERRPGIGDIGLRKAGRVRDRDDALVVRAAGEPPRDPPRSISSISAKTPRAGSASVHWKTSGIRKSIWR